MIVKRVLGFVNKHGKVDRGDLYPLQSGDVKSANALFLAGYILK
jgi:hypothetical protein